MKFLHRIQQGILAVCLGVLLGWSFAESQTAELKIKGGEVYTLRQQGRKWSWKSTNNQPLTAQKLKEHLETRGIGHNCFKELGRLILAQSSSLHDNNQNTGPGYMNQPNVARDLCRQSTLKDLINHLFDHGHLGWYPHAQQINRDDFNAIVGVNPQVAPRGIFNIDPTIRRRIVTKLTGLLLSNTTAVDGDFILGGPPAFPHLKDYGVDPQNQQVNANSIFTHPNLEEAAINLITCLFSSNTFDEIQIGLVRDERFTIDATYNGDAIPGIDYTHPTGSPLPPTNCLGLQNNGIPTNRICLVVGVNSGRIYIASLFPEG